VTVTDDTRTTDWAIAASVRRWAVDTPDAPCLCGAGITRSWRQVHERAGQVANGLIGFGVTPQQRVAFLGRNRTEFFEVLVGTSMAGIVSFAINTRLSAREMLEIVNDSHSRVLFVEPEYRDQLIAHRAAMTHVEQIVVFDDSEDGYEGWRARQSPEDPRLLMAEDDIAMQIYTSGTSGTAKGVMFSNAAIRASTAINFVLELDQQSVVLIPMPVFHAAGASLGIQALNAGAVSVVASRVVPDELLALIAEHQVTMTGVVPSVLRDLVESPRFAEHDVSSLRTISYAAAPMPPEILRVGLERLRCRFVQIYGLTETNMATVLYPDDHVDRAHPERLSSVGRALPYVSVRIVDAETGEDLPEGSFGEIWIKAPSGMSGYWGAPEATRAAMTDDGYVRSGDGGYFEDGYLYLQDRIKDMIVSGGENVFAVEVENALLTHHAIHDVAVIGVPSARWGETVRAIVVREPSNSDLTEAEVIAFAKTILAGYKCPTSVEFIETLPRNATGKVLKRELRGPAAAAVTKGDKRA
jgi:acyl-CoA synthetase (AMP-forming)/AMP-acid ligase II